MNEQQKVIGLLKGKSEAVWELIKEAIDKGFSEEIKEEEMELAKETYERECVYQIDKGIYRYIIIEDYNIQDDLYYRFYKEEEVKGDDKDRFAEIYEDYFSDVNGWEMILLIDMKELKIYQLNKRVEYISEEMR